MKIDYCIPVYHVNSPEEVSAVVKSFDNGDGRLFFTKENGYWAGNGMYFWDNEGNANYWKKNRKKNRNLDSDILVADLLLDEDSVLDLTNEEVLNVWNDLWPKVAKKYNTSIDCSPGKKINLICRTLGTVKVVKVCGFYPQKNEHSFFEGNIEKPHMTSRTKTIFCIKDSDRLRNVTSIE